MKSIIEIIAGDHDFSTLVTAVKAADLVTLLSEVGSFTVFAPSNEAFAKVPKETLAVLLANKQKIDQTLKHHIVVGKILSKDVKAFMEVKASDGSLLKIATKNGITVNASKITKADIVCSNGVIHIIDTVMM